MVFGQEGANTYVCTPEIEAQMAELVDASDSKSGIGNNVQVRFLFWAQSLPNQTGKAVLYEHISILEEG